MILDVLKKKPYYLFLIFGFFFLVLSFLQKNDSTLDINVHDTYFVIEHSVVQLFFLLFFLMFFCAYWLLEKLTIKLNNYLEYFHIASTLILFLIILNYSLFFSEDTSMQNLIYPSYVDYSFMLIILIVMFLTIQLFWVFSILLLGIRKLIKSL